MKELTLDEVAEHNNSNDCWIVIFNKVYDVTDFLRFHPGGSEILIEYAGYDATGPFRGTGHDSETVHKLDKYYVGDLVPSQRIYAKYQNVDYFNIENVS